MVTDPQRQRRSDPGNPDVCNVYSLHKIFSKQEEVDNINVECRRAGIGCVDCKKILAKNMNDYFAPIRARREEFAKDEDATWDMLKDGANRAGEIAEATMREVRRDVGLPEL